MGDAVGRDLELQLSAEAATHSPSFVLYLLPSQIRATRLLPPSTT